MELNSALDKVEQLARGGRWNRLVHHPFNYLYALLYANIFFKKKGILKNTRTFFGTPMTVLLPAATDIFLTGGKTHDSEIRLARYLVNHVRSDDIILDVGAHFGYFTLLCSVLADKGRVYAFEPSKNNFSLLSANAAQKHITVYNQAVSDKSGALAFFEFPALYSEYNSTDTSQFEGEAWFKQAGVHKITVDGITLDNFCLSKNIQPDLIKIDVEGGEADVIRGAARVIEQSRPVIAMEFVCRERINEPHHRARELLLAIGYTGYVIGQAGTITPVENIDQYLAENKLESDNIIFKPVL
jgi:FkbM family methyltransferase